MGKRMNWMQSIFAVAVSFLFFAGSNVEAEEKEIPDFKEMTAQEMVQDMGAGWNLGNTLDGHNDLTPGETAWQGVVTTQELIKSVHDMGFQTLRVPVTWGTMIDDENNYAIDGAWMKRVKEIVGYGIREGMYVIINIHHDGADSAWWLNAAAEDLEPVCKKFSGVWKNIATEFKDYDEHLIFESMNEVNGGEEEINKLNQAFVDAVRATGSNNAKRWLSIPGSGANIGTAYEGFPFPKDTIENRLFFAVHYYDGAMGLTETKDITEWKKSDSKNLKIQLQSLGRVFTEKGIPVILGEYGCIDKGNAADRAYFNEVTARLCRNMGVVPVYWDNGYHDEAKKPDYGFSLVNRETGEAWYPEIVHAIMRGAYLDGTYQEVVKNPTIVKAESITLSKEKLTMEAGAQEEISVAVLPENSNDVVVWKSQDESVATVFSGKIRAVGNGKAEIIAFSQSGSAQSSIVVQVGEEEQVDEKEKEDGIKTANARKPLQYALLVIGIGAVFMVGAGIMKNRRNTD